MPSRYPEPSCPARSSPAPNPASRAATRPLRAGDGAAPLGLLPTPTPQEVAGFAALYERKYGARLDSDQAQRLLAGLMRFLYLTRTAPPEAAGPDASSPGQAMHTPPADTSLTGVQSLKEVT